MNAPRPPFDRAAARRAAVELVRAIDDQRTRRAATVANVKLPLALQILDHCASDPVTALLLVAELIDPATLPAHTDTTPTAGRPGQPRLRLVPTTDLAITRRKAQ